MGTPIPYVGKCFPTVDGFMDYLETIKFGAWRRRQRIIANRRLRHRHERLRWRVGGGGQSVSIRRWRRR